MLSVEELKCCMMVNGVQCVTILNGALGMDKLPVENLDLKSLQSPKWLLILLASGVCVYGGDVVFRTSYNVMQVTK